MARIPLVMPPGVYRNGTEYQSKGRFYDTNLVRWYGSALGPVGGWRLKTSTTLSGVPRAAIAWKANDGGSWLGIGTHSKLYVMSVLGTVSDVTPSSSYTAGQADATASGGYGSGTYGSGAYGTPRPGNAEITEATQWTLDKWGEDLLAVSPADAELRQWDLSVGVGTVAATVTNSPACKAVVVTPEGFVFALATTTPSTVSWCDQRVNNVWSPSATNQAGSFQLQTAGKLMCGKAVKGATLLFTDLDVHAAQYIGGTLVYGFDKVGDACGAISRQCVAAFDQQAIWMSPSIGFWLWNGGAVVPLDCDVLDYIRLDINLQQATKIVAIVNSDYSEIEFRYCSSGSTEIDRCVVVNYRNWHWNIGRVARTGGVDKGVFTYPIMISATGSIYEHEVGVSHDSEEIYATFGPMEFGNGDNIVHVLGLYPDEKTVGDVTASFFVRRNPNDTPAEYGPYTLTAKTDVRFSGGLIEAKFTGDAATSWRVGTFRAEVVTGEER